MIVEKAKTKEQTHLFNANQDVYLISYTGSNRCLVKGRFRGKSRFIKAWVNKANITSLIPVDVDEKTYQKNHVELIGLGGL